MRFRCVSDRAHGCRHRSGVRHRRSEHHERFRRSVRDSFRHQSRPAVRCSRRPHTREAHCKSGEHCSCHRHKLEGRHRIEAQCSRHPNAERCTRTIGARYIRSCKNAADWRSGRPMDSMAAGRCIHHSRAEKYCHNWGSCAARTSADSSAAVAGWSRSWRYCRDRLAPPDVTPSSTPAAPEYQRNCEGRVGN